MSKRYILINLNQGESKEARQDRLKEQTRWVMFSVIILMFLSANASVFWVNHGYNKLIQKKETEITEINFQLMELQSKGKNVSKEDIISLSNIEEGRFMWAPVMQALGDVTPDDVAITALSYKFGKWGITGIATIYEDLKDFDIVNRYVGKLQNYSHFADNFSRIKFSEYSRQKFRGQEIIMFTVTATVSSKPKIN